MSRSPLSRLKDAALEKTVLLLLRSKIERYGELRSLKVNTTDKQLAGEIRLLGDPIPIEITQARYRLEGDGEACRLIFFEVQTSKPWLQHLIEDRFPEFSVPVPGYVRTLL
jgi:hypothetical protein